MGNLAKALRMVRSGYISVASARLKGGFITTDPSPLLCCVTIKSHVTPKIRSSKLYEARVMQVPVHCGSASAPGIRRRYYYSCTAAASLTSPTTVPAQDSGTRWQYREATRHKHIKVDAMIKLKCNPRAGIATMLLLGIIR